MVPPASSEITVPLALSTPQTQLVLRMSTAPVVILKELKVLCFDGDLEVVILKDLRPVSPSLEGLKAEPAQRDWAGDLETRIVGQLSARLKP
jgi:hypothetical protein